jgi:translation initiation factor 1
MNNIDLSLLQDLIVTPDTQTPELQVPITHLPSPKSEKNLRVWKEKQKGGRVATVIKGFEHASEQNLTDLAKTLKTKLATGGAAKNKEITLQGDVRSKTLILLKELGHTAKQAGG